MLLVEQAAEVRCALLLISILNTMFVEALFINTREMSEECGFMGLLCINTWLLKRVGAVMLSQLVTKPATMLVPRMFDTTEHLSSCGVHDGVSDSIFRPSMSYFFEPRQQITKEELNFKSIVENSKESHKESKKRLKRGTSIKSHNLKLVSKTMVRMSTFKNLAKSHPEHDLRRYSNSYICARL